MEHLNENLGALAIELKPEELREIDIALSKITVFGGRMNAAQMEQVDVS